MKRLYMVCCAALQPHDAHVGVAVHLDYHIASSGDEISEYGWERCREQFPPSRGFVQHRVMIRTVDDKTLAILDIEEGFSIDPLLEEQPE